ncbi:MAG: NTP transferase domain-containing protein [Bacteroidota bacterium]
MSAQPYQKHGKLTKPQHGWYGRQEWAIVGTLCSHIKSLARTVTEALQHKYRFGYLDADHGTPNADAKPSATTTYTNKKGWHQWEAHQPPGKADFWQQFNEADVVLVNGNHYQAARQVVVIDAKKYDSVKKRLPQLTEVAMWAYAEGMTEPHDFLQEAFPHWQEIPTMQLNDPTPLVSLIDRTLEAARQPLSAIVLAGGKSQRMGNDKTVIDYQGRPQREHLYQMLQPMVDVVYLSCRPEQVEDLSTRFQVLPDTFLGAGPYGAILSALQRDPNRAWLVVAVDMPYVTEEGVKNLIQGRNPMAMGTAYRNPENGLPEPLLSIWEPKAYKYLLTLLAHGINSPRKALMITENTTLLDPINERIVRNVNTPEELDQVRNEMVS